MTHRHLSSLTATSMLLFGAVAGAQTAPSQAPSETSPVAAPEPAAPPKSEPVAKPAADVAPPAPTSEPPPKKEPVTAKWDVSLYGFIEFDAMRDSTQAFHDSPANNPLLRSDGSFPAYMKRGTGFYGVTYGSTAPRMLFTARNTRFGFKITAPEYHRIQTSATLETDFMGNQPQNPYTKQGEVSNQNTPTETSFFSNAALRVRHAYVKMNTDYADVLFGQYYHLFGWQPYYFPASVAFLGLPNMVFGRSPQLRVGKTIKSSAINAEIALAALRPAQADSGMPDLQAGLRFGINGWKGAHGLGSAPAVLDAAGVGVSAVFRKFKVAEYTNNLGDPTVASDIKAANGYGISVDGFIPIIPTSSIEDKSNAFALTGSFVTGAGIGDLFTGGLVGGMPFPRPDGTQGPYTGFYGANIDPGIVMYNASGVVRVLKWTAFMAGFQYFLPIAKGRVVLTGNYTQASSPNLRQTSNGSYDNEVTAGADPTRTFRKAEYFDVNLFGDVTPAIRVGLSWQRITQTFLAGKVGTIDLDGASKDDIRMMDTKEHNDRYEVSGYFFF
jgi:hypothetical protein